jgi:Mrp family chromosome partitioning ATPase/uncharacterized protein involved in exopolysaccharide biosynthesis
LKEFQRIHRLLRGRYLWAILLAMILGPAGAYTGFCLGTRSYRSSGVIRIMPVVPKVMYAVDEKGSLPMYETFVDAQIALLRSQRVTEQAMDEAPWRKIRQSPDKSDEAIARFAEGMEITRQGELIWVRAVNTDPQIAVAAVNATIAAYQKVYGQLEAESDDKRRQAREDLQARLRIEWNGLRDEIQAAAQTYGTDDLKAQFSYKELERNRLESAKRDVEMALATLTQTQKPPTTAPTIKDPEDVAFRYHDARMMQLLDRKAKCLEELETARANSGSESPAAKAAQKLLAAAQQGVDDYVKTFAKYYEEHPLISDRTDPRELNVRLGALQALYEKANVEMLALGKQALRISELRERAADVKQKLDETTRAIEQLSVESQIMGRVVVMGQADRPLAPYRDTRLSTAAVAGVGGVAAGFGAMLLLGLMRGRFECPDDADSQPASFALLGAVPALTEDLSNPERAALAALCVHEIRTRLQIIGQAEPRSVFGVTSPTAGAGKTSLTLALGVSFAAANQRTLLIDCDIVGGGLTRTADAIARRRIGTILLAKGLIGERELEDALRESIRSGRRLGEVILEFGYATDETLDEALAIQGEETLGLLDALDGIDVASCAAETNVEGLYVMPLGDATVHDVASLSPAVFRNLLDRCSRCFDVVIVDTGPILGSLEASIVTSQMDGVILVVAKGDTNAGIRKSITQLAVVGARVAGMVFNRAREQDVTTYSGHQGSSYGERSSSGGAVVEHRDAPEARRFGPIARAVASWSPALGAGSRRNRTRSANRAATPAAVN